jgi:hypothetical protein
MKYLLLGWALVISNPAFADSVDSAFALCRAIDGTGASSTPCKVSTYTVTATLDMDSSDARDFCSLMAQMVRDQNAGFDGRWTLQIKSPYSNGTSIAFCTL